jgi:hypothetical protein
MGSPRDRAYAYHELLAEVTRWYVIQIEDLQQQLNYYKGDTVLAELTLLRTEIRSLAKTIREEK